MIKEWKRWTKEEIKILRQVYPSEPKNIIQEKLNNKTWSSISAMACRLKIKRPKEIYNPWIKLKSKPKNFIHNKPHSKETKRKISEKEKGLHHSPKTEFKKGHIPWNKNNNEFSKIMKNYWQNPEFRKKTLEATFKSLRKKPSSLEEEFMKLIEKNNLPFKYVGDGKIIIEGFCPDFIESNGKKLIIEIFGPWHEREDIQKRDKRRLITYPKYGYKTLILWWYDFLIDKHHFRSDYEENIINKVREFICQ